jgi:CheY-like chemotaxis protein
MASRLRVLVVEDDPDEAQAVEDACRRAVDQPDMVVEVVGDQSSAVDLLGSQDFDLVVCDLAIPHTLHSLVPDRDEGLKVIQAVRRAQPGLPIIVLSEYGKDPKILRRIIEEGGSADPYGLGVARAMIDPFPKEEFLACEQAIADSLRRSAGVASIPITGPGAGALKVGEERAVQILARVAGGAAARVIRLDEGLSGAKVLRVSLTAEDGGHRGKIVAKIGVHERALREREAYEAAALQLPPNLGAPLAKSVEAGAGRFAAIIYRDLEEHDRDLFQILAADPAEAGTVVRSLREQFRSIHERAAAKTFTLLTLRRRIVNRSDLALAGELAGRIRALDGISIPGRECLQHGDLHGKNVLVNNAGAPMLIDYADFGQTSCVLDPVTAELSAVFHPRAADSRGVWPSAQRISEYFDLEAYLDGCPFPDYIRTCRAWQQAVGAEREIAAVVLAYALRQLRYDETDHACAKALVEAALNQVEEPG